MAKGVPTGRPLAKIIGERTLTLSAGERVRARKAATAALTTYAGHRGWVFVPTMRRLPISDHTREEAFQDFCGQADKYGSYVEKHAGFSSEVRDLLSGVLSDDNPYPFAILRNMFPTRVTPWASAHQHEWFIRDFAYDLISSGIIHASGQIHRRKANSLDEPRKIVVSSPCSQKSILSDGDDLPLRYRQATPELRFVGEVKAAAQMAARIVVFACVENPVSDPILLLTLSDILRDMESDERGTMVKHLAEPNFSVFDNWAQNLTQNDPHPNQKVMMDRGTVERHWVSMDVNRLGLQAATMSEGNRQAVSRLLGQINAVESDSKSKTIPIFLKRGDALVIDNYRVLHRRQELGYRENNPLLWGRPPIRWLQIYYGFPPT
jgi:hypothetical protein